MAELGLRCSMRDLWSLAVACGTQFPEQGSNLSPLHWEHGVLATGPPGKSLYHFLEISEFPTFFFKARKSCPSRNPEGHVNPIEAVPLRWLKWCWEVRILCPQDLLYPSSLSQGQVQEPSGIQRTQFEKHCLKYSEKKMYVKASCK